MKEEKTNYHPLFVTAILVCAGLISPSNGVDEGIYKSDGEMMHNMLLAIVAGAVLFLVWKIASYCGWTNNNRSEENKSLK